MKSSSRAVLALALAVGLFTAACSSDSGGDASTESTTPSSSAESSTDATQPAAASTDATQPAAATTDATQPAAATTDAPKSGGSATMLMPAELRGWDPLVARGGIGTDYSQLIAVYDQLVRVDPDGTVVPRLAESIESSSGDFAQWTLSLRSGVTFTDGTVFDAAAVKFNWDRHADKALASRCASAAAEIAETTVVDATTLSVQLAAPNSQFPRRLMGCLGWIASPTAIESAGEDFANHPVGAGPFMLKEWTPDVQAVLARNPSYWDAPRPYLDEIIFQVVPDTPQRTDAFIAGQADGIFLTSTDANTARISDGGYDVQRVDLFGGTAMQLNTALAPTDDVRVRQALVAAYNPEEADDLAADGHATPAVAFFPSGSPFYNADIVPATNNIEHARELIAEYVAEKGGPVEIHMVGYPQLQTWFETTAQQWEAISSDVHVTVDIQEITAAQKARFEGTFNATIAAIIGQDPEPSLTNALSTGASENWSRYSNPTVDEALLVGKTTDDLAERKQAYDTVTKALFEDAPLLILFKSEYFTAVSNDIGGLRVYDLGEIDVSQLYRN